MLHVIRGNSHRGRKTFLVVGFLYLKNNFMKSNPFLLGTDVLQKKLLDKWQKEEEFKKERWFKFFKNLFISFPYFVIVVAILLFLFRFILPILEYSWVFIFSMAFILACYWSDREAIKYIKQKIIDWNQAIKPLES